MKNIYLQYWEESERGWGVRPDGCSLHLSTKDSIDYINAIYNGRDTDFVPNEYDRVVGELIPVTIDQKLYDEITKNGGSLRLMQSSMKNLFSLEEIRPIVNDTVYN